MFRWLKDNGPGMLVVAAFIGPGTVTICAISGASYGFSLLWALLLSIIATIVLQEMASRVGLITQKGLTEVIGSQIKSVLVRRIILFLVFAAIVIGNAAYEAGNISGAAIGLHALTGHDLEVYPFVIAGLAFALLWSGNYKVVERALVILVFCMSISFVISALLTKPDLILLAKGLLVPTIPGNSLYLVIGIIGTTVVPYNLFLHAAVVSEKWKYKSDHQTVKTDLVISVILGGLVSMSIVVAAAQVSGQGIDNALDLANGLEPLYGSVARIFLGTGLLAAGITSAITAPLAAAYVAKNCFGWTDGLTGTKFRMVWVFILLSGVLFSTLHFKPLAVITFAQVANGIVLPLIAILLLWVVNREEVMDKYINNKAQNIISFIIIIITLILGTKGILQAII